MSIAINSNFERDQLEAAGGQTVFNYSFPVFDETYLDVYQRAGDETPNDETQILTLGVDYSVTGVGEEAGGTIVLTVAATAGDIITIVGAEPIERQSVFQDLNPFTVALNQQLNEQTVMQQQTYTYWNHLTPRYNFDELISDEVRPLKRILPMLPDGHVWVGRGELNDDPDDIVTRFLGEVGGGNVISTGPDMRKSIAVWTGNGTEITDSNLEIIGAKIDRTDTGATEDVTGFTDLWGAFHWPAHGIGTRPAAPSNGDTYYDTGLNQFFGYLNGVWTAFSTGGDNDTPIIIPVNQVGHGLTAGQWVRIDQTLMKYVTAQADTAEHAEVVGTVKSVVDADNFLLQVVGYVSAGTYAGLTPGGVYFLSDTIPGDMTMVEPATLGRVSLPVFIAETATTGYVRQFRGMILNDPLAVTTSGGEGEPVIITVTQVAHGFTVGQVVYNDANNHYALALSTTATLSRAVGFVVEVVDADNFKLQQSGWTTALGVLVLTPATQYWLSDTVAGAITAVEPTTIGRHTKPMLQAVNASSGWILPQRPLEIEDEEQVVKDDVNQVAHGFSVGDVIYNDATDHYALASTAGAVVNKEKAVGMVVEVVDADNFVLQQSGFTDNFGALTVQGGGPLVGGTPYWLSATIDGKLTATEPTAAGTYSKPQFQAVNASSGWILPQKPTLNVSAGSGGAIHQVQTVNLRNQTTQTIAATTWTALTGIEITITPSNVAHRVLVDFSLLHSLAASSGANFYFRLTRNGAVISDAVCNIVETASIKQASNSHLPNISQSIPFLTRILYTDSPALVAAITYGVEMFCTSGGGTFYLNGQGPLGGSLAGKNGITHIVAMEIT